MPLVADIVMHKQGVLWNVLVSFCIFSGIRKIFRCSFFPPKNFQFIQGYHECIFSVLVVKCFNDG